jgi:hypothetical protein
VLVEFGRAHATDMTNAFRVEVLSEFMVNFIEERENDAGAGVRERRHRSAEAQEPIENLIAARRVKLVRDDITNVAALIAAELI